MAKVAIDCDIDGIICSPNEVSLRENFGHGFSDRKPGIRLAQDNPGDQKKKIHPRKP